MGVLEKQPLGGIGFQIPCIINQCCRRHACKAEAIRESRQIESLLGTVVFLRVT